MVCVADNVGELPSAGRHTFRSGPLRQEPECLEERTRRSLAGPSRDQAEARLLGLPNHVNQMVRLLHAVRPMAPTGLAPTYGRCSDCCVSGNTVVLRDVREIVPAKASQQWRGDGPRGTIGGERTTPATYRSSLVVLPLSRPLRRGPPTLASSGGFADHLLGNPRDQAVEPFPNFRKTRTSHADRPAQVQSKLDGCPFLPESILRRLIQKLLHP